MKKYIIVLSLLLIATFSLAQSNTQDVVYLKNGSIIHGTIVERIPNKSIKIKTQNGNVFIYEINKVKKISKGSHSNLNNVVYLKNGNIIKGTIVEQIPEKSIKIKTQNGNIFVYEMDKIKKVTKDSKSNDIKNNTLNNEKRSSKSQGLISGYKGIIELGYQLGVGSFPYDRIKFDIINGYQLNPYFSFGIGTGVRYYYDIEGATIPFYADFRGNFLDKNISPYLSFGIGYSFSATNDFKGVGLILEPSAGVSFKISKKSAFHIGIGYEMQNNEVYYYLYDSNTYNKEKANYGSITFNIAISF